MSSGNLEKPETAWIGIDQSYSGFGLVILSSHRADRLELWKFPPQESDAQRLAYVSSKLHGFFVEENFYRQQYTTFHIAMEGYAHASRFNREKMGELGGLVKCVTYCNFLKSPEIIAPTVLKKFMTGKGTATKDDMLKAVQKYNPDVKNHNVADAYALALYIKENQ